MGILLSNIVGCGLLIIITILVILNIIDDIKISRIMSRMVKGSKKKKRK